MLSGSSLPRILLLLSVVLFLSHLTEGAENEYADLNVICIACSSGIGKSAAEILLAEGAKVVVSARSKDKLLQITKNFPKTGLAFAADASKTDELEALVSAAKKFFGKETITSIIWAPTSTEMGVFRLIGADKMREMMQTQMYLNVYQLVKVVDLVKEDLIASAKAKPSSAAVVSVSSVISMDQGFGYLPYGMSKAAQDYLIRNLALEFASKDVRFNTINPAGIDTPIYESFGPMKDELLRDGAARHALGRLGTSEECGHLMAFLLSKKAGFMTGQNIRVDGGNSLIGSHADWFSSPLGDPSDDSFFPTRRKWTREGHFAGDKKQELKEDL